MISQQFADEIIRQNDELERENEALREALRLFRSLVKEGDVPRYRINSGAALNSVIEEVVDPALNS